MVKGKDQRHAPAESAFLVDVSQELEIGIDDGPAVECPRRVGERTQWRCGLPAGDFVNLFESYEVQPCAFEPDRRAFYLCLRGEGPRGYQHEAE